MLQQIEFFDIPSPCIKVCTLNKNGFCRGCMRNRLERFEWEKMTNIQKKEVLRLCYQRALRYRKIKYQEQYIDTSFQYPLF